MNEPNPRRRLAGICMLLGAIALAVPPFLGPPNPADDAGERLAALAADPATAVAKSLFFQVAVILLLPGVVAIVGRTRGRGAAGVVTGGVIYAAGLFGAFAFVLMAGIEAALAGDAPVSATLVDAANTMGESPAAIPTFILALLFFHLLGLPWLTFGMLRARQVHWWLPAVATTGTPCAFSAAEAVWRRSAGD